MRSPLSPPITRKGKLARSLAAARARCPRWLPGKNARVMLTRHELVGGISPAAKASQTRCASFSAPILALTA